MKKIYLLPSLFILLATTAFSQSKKSVLYEVVTAKQRQEVSNIEINLFQTSTRQLPSRINNVIAEKQVLSLQKSASIALYNQAPANFSLNLPLATNHPVKLKLIKEDINSIDDFSYGIIDIDGPKANAGVLKGLHYRGYVNGDSSSIAAFSVFANGEVMCLFSGKEGNFNLGKAGSVPGEYILFNSKSMKAPLGFSCGTSQLPVIESQSTEPNAPLRTQELPSIICKKVRMYWEADYKLYSNNFLFDLTGTANYLSGFFNQVAVMFLNEGIRIELTDLYIWTTPDSYNISTSSDGLASFKSRWNFLGNNFKGDLAVLIDGAPTNNGGTAYLLKNSFCNRSFTYGYANVYGSYNEIPTYSWDVYVVTHEMGHLMGSDHTHWCGWGTGAGGTCGAIDDCYTTEAGASCLSCGATTSINPFAPAGFGGTVMSYCHLVGGVGITLASGFGPLPQNAIRTTVTNANCTVFDNVWTGAYSTAWEEPVNWSCGSIPTATTDVTIPGGLINYPIINSAAICRQITHQPGASVLVNTGFNLTVFGKTTW
jgi:hypothetical protein